MRFETVSLSDVVATTAWDDYVSRHPRATPCHLSAWLWAIHATYSFEPLLYTVKDDGGALQGVFPLFRIRGAFTGVRVVSLPFSDYGGPLCNDQIVEEELVRHVRGECQNGIRYLEIRGGLARPGDLLPYNYYKRHVMDLRAGIGALQNKFDKKTIQYSIRKAEKAGVVIKQDNTRAGLEAFYRLNNLTRRKHGVPSQPHAFFENLYSRMIAAKAGFILVAEHDSTVAAASLFLTVARQIHYKYNASDPALLKKLSPNHLLTWHVITWGVENGYQSLDFGRTSPDNQGLIRYKNMWGMEDQDIPYYYYPRVKGAVATKESGISYRLATSMWRHLPLPVMEFSSSILYKHLG
jgi:CelD/BcsL family acetyltransferase involved in cellulose biosynthesis